MEKLKKKLNFTIQQTDLQFQLKENTVIYFNVKNLPGTNMIKRLVYRIKTRGTVRDHPQFGHFKSVCTEAIAKAVLFIYFFFVVFFMSQYFIGHPILPY